MERQSKETAWFVVGCVLLAVANILIALLANWAFEVDFSVLRVGLFLTVLEVAIAFAKEIWDAS